MASTADKVDAEKPSLKAQPLPPNNIGMALDRRELRQKWQGRWPAIGESMKKKKMQAPRQWKKAKPRGGFGTGKKFRRLESVAEEIESPDQESLESPLEVQRNTNMKW